MLTKKTLLSDIQDLYLELKPIICMQKVTRIQFKIVIMIESTDIYFIYLT
jgi:hypothetical protein